MTQKDIAEKTGASTIMISYLVRGMRYTLDPDVAREVARKTGKAPIEHISPKIRDVILKAYPEMERPLR